jgi:hypothetical protein
MKRLLFLLIFVLFSSFAYGLTEQEAKSVSDSFVVQHSQFFHRYSILSDVKVFRKTYSITEDSFTFVYMAFAQLNGKDVKGKFYITVNRADSSVEVDVERPETENYDLF